MTNTTLTQEVNEFRQTTSLLTQLQSRLKSMLIELEALVERANKLTQQEELRRQAEIMLREREEDTRRFKEEQASKALITALGGVLSHSQQPERQVGVLLKSVLLEAISEREIEMVNNVTPEQIEASMKNLQDSMNIRLVGSEKAINTTN